MLITLHHLYKGTYSFWVPKEHAIRAIAEYETMEWFRHAPKPKKQVKRRDSDRDY